jgi:hypothetical protein
MAGQSDDERVWVFEEGVIADWTGLAWLEGRFGDAVKGITKLVVHSFHFPRRYICPLQQRLNHLIQQATSRLLLLLAIITRSRDAITVTILAITTTTTTTTFIVASNHIQCFSQGSKGRADVRRNRDRMGSRSRLGRVRGDFRKSREEGGQIGSTGTGLRRLVG